MFLGIIDKAYTEKYGYSQGILRLKAQGYDAIDYQGFVDTSTALWQLPEDRFLGMVKETGEFLKEQGIVVYQAHAPWEWPARHTTADERKDLFERVHRALKGCQALGCKNLVIHPLMPFLNNEGQDAETVLGMNLGFLGAVTDYARYYGVTICLENLPFSNLPLATPEEIRNFVEDMNLENLRVCLDTGHCNVRGFSAGDAVRLIGPELLKCLHVHDNDGVADQHRMPGEGTIDWEDFRQALRDIHFQGALSLEWSPRDETDELLGIQKARILANP